MKSVWVFSVQSLQSRTRLLLLCNIILQHNMRTYRHAVEVPLWPICYYWNTLSIKMTDNWWNANTVCSNYPWAIYSLFLSLQRFFFSTFRQDVCNEARCLCDNLACSIVSVTDDAVLEREGKKCGLPWKEICCLLNKKWKQRTGSDILLTGKKKILNCTLVHPTLKRHCKTPLVLAGPRLIWGCFLSKIPRVTHKQDFSRLKLLLRCTQISWKAEESHRLTLFWHTEISPSISRCGSTAVFPGTVCSLAEETLNKNPPCHQLGMGGRVADFLWRTNNCAPPLFFLAPSLPPPHLPSPTPVQQAGRQGVLSFEN